MGIWDHQGTTFQQGAIGGRLRLSAGSVLLFRHDLLDYRPLGREKLPLSMCHWAFSQWEIHDLGKLLISYSI